MVDYCGRARESNLNLTAEQVGCCGCCAPIRNVNQLHPGCYLKQLPAHMARTSYPSGAHADLARIGLGVGNEFGNRFCWYGWMHHHDQRSADHADDCKVTDEIEIELVVHRSVSSRGAIDPEKCIAVSG